MDATSTAPTGHQPTQTPAGPDCHLAATPLLDLDHPSIRAVVVRRGWTALDPMARIGAVYDFVRDEVEFGYNADDDLPASRVLADGYGQCNTKATLLMALLRASGIPCRFHAATVHQRLQAGVVPDVVRRWAPQEILHSWVEVEGDDGWVRLEGVIIDDRYLAGLRRHLDLADGPLLGYGVGTEDVGAPAVAWCGRDTEIQMTGLERDLGVHDDPDTWYATAGTNLSGPRAWLYRLVIRHVMNRRVRALRATPVSLITAGRTTGHSRRCRDTGTEVRDQDDQTPLAGDGCARAVPENARHEPAHGPGLRSDEVPAQTSPVES